MDLHVGVLKLERKTETRVSDVPKCSKCYIQSENVCVCVLQGVECGVDEDTRRSCRSKGKTEVRETKGCGGGVHFEVLRTFLWWRTSCNKAQIFEPHHQCHKTLILL